MRRGRWRQLGRETFPGFHLGKTVGVSTAIYFACKIIIKIAGPVSWEFIKLRWTTKVGHFCVYETASGGKTDKKPPRTYAADR